MFRCVLIGRGTLLLRSAATLQAAGHRIAAILGDDEEVQLWAQFEGIPWSDRSEHLKELIGEEVPDYLFSINNLEILKADLLKTASRGSINLHDGPLPRYAGLYVSTRALLNREKSHGITWHMMEPGIDTGDILLQKYFTISPDETTFSLNLKIHRATEESFDDLLRGLEMGTLSKIPQDLSRRSYFSGRDPFPGNAILDWQLPAAELELRVRALDFGFTPNPWKGPHLWTGQQWILARNLVVLKKEDLKRNAPGTFIRCDPDGLVIAAADALVKINRFVSLQGIGLEPLGLSNSLHWSPGQILPQPPTENSVSFISSQKRSAGESIFDLIGSSIDQGPEETALETINGECWSRRELHEEINRLTELLDQEGVRLEEKVGICIPRSPEMVAGLLAILKAGGAYVPLDTALPPDRLKFMVRESGLRTILAARETERLFHQMGTRIVLADGDKKARPETLTSIPLSGKNAAYLLYTSGSTGKPKGVLVEHRSVVQYIRAALADFAYTERDRILQFASLSFDTAGEEIYAALASGATLVFRDGEMISNTRRFLKACCDRGITVLNLPTSYWHELVKAFDENDSPLPATLRLIIIGGEAARPDLLKIWRQRIGDRIRLVNTYGATELSMVSTHHELAGPQSNYRNEKSAGSAVPIGLPVVGSSLHILDAFMDPVTPGAWGELYVGGTGLARGYWGRSDLNHSKFVADPFSNGGRLFRTGDRARLNETHVFEVAGRMDFQIKWKGHRIEPEEIEQALLLHPDISDAVAILQENEGLNSHLVVYLVMGPGRTKEILQDELIEHLNELLPSWMIPSAFVFLDRLPLTNSQKIDRTALPLLKDSPPFTKNSLSAPVLWTSETEEKLAELWQRLLPPGPLLPDDNFFRRGGDSLLAIHLLDGIEKNFGVEIPVSEFLNSGNLRGLAGSIVKAKERGNSVDNLEEFRHLVLLRKGKEEAGTIIILPGGPGSEKELLGHAEWTGEFQNPFNIYGLCVQANDAYRDVEEMAAAYALEIRAISKLGPFWIMGECLAAPLAFEICRQLQGSGPEPSSLFLLDSRYPSLFLWKQRILHVIQSKELKKLKSKTRQRLRFWKTRFRESSWEKWPGLAALLCHRQWSRILALFYLASPEHLIKEKDFIYSRYIRLLQAYRIPDSSLRIRTVLVLSSELNAEWQGKTGWESKISGTLITLVLPGTHLGYIGGNIKVAARTIEAACFGKGDKELSPR